MTGLQANRSHRAETVHQRDAGGAVGLSLEAAPPGTSLMFVDARAGREPSCGLPGHGNDVVHGPLRIMPPRVAVRAQADSGRWSRPR